MSLLAELKRRKVFKVGAAYLVIAWVAVQAASIAFPTFDAPLWALRTFILVAMLGFPVVLLLTWVIDLTPEGVRVDPSTSGSGQVFAAVAILVTLALGWYYYGQPSFRKGDVTTPVAADRNSIAVLPFANMSGKPDEEYFSDGMTEELLNVLAKVPQLKVVARTSVFQFKDKGGDVRDIGRKLGVTHIVEGSVRRDGQQVRITAQLVRVSDGFHVWSETYDRKLEGVFALQDDIARQIADALKQSMGVTVPLATRAPVDSQAYDEYLKGRALLRQRTDLPGAIAHFQAAVAKAPEFAAGWSSLSLAHDVSYWWVKQDKTQTAEELAKAAAAAESAAALDPNLAACEHALANVARARFKYADAERHYLRAMQLDPSYPDAREDYSELLYEVGRLEDSKTAARQLVTLDPYFGVGWTRVWNIATAQDARAEADESMQQLRVVAPRHFITRFGPLDYALAYGRADEARAALAYLEKNYPPDADIARQLLPWALGEPVVDAARLRAAMDAAPSGELMNYLVARGDIAAFNTFMEDGGAIQQSYYFIDLYRSKAAGQAMLRDLSVKPLLVKYGFPAYWRERGWPKGCEPLGETDFQCSLGAAKAP